MSTNAIDTSTVKVPSCFSRAIKRGFDIVCSVVGIICFSWLMALIWLAIYLEDRKSPLYKQERIGRNGKPFDIYKFRSMVVDAEVNGMAFCTPNDPRLTKVGKFIRFHHLDELPQLWNVLKGDMSIVGYRPDRKIYIDQIMEQDPRYAWLYAMRPGLFSMATRYNGYCDSMEKWMTRLEMDLDYMNNYSFWRDIKIIWVTAYAILSGKRF